MKRTVKKPKSAFAKLRGSIAKAVPGGSLPKPVARFYEESDGLTVTLNGNGLSESATLIGLRAMFGSSFKPPRVLERADEADEALNEGPFADELYTSEIDVVSKADLARVNLLLRLKLLATIEGKSAALAIDLHSGKKEPLLYYVQNARDAWPLALGFEELVTYFQSFGTRCWYFAFLDSKAQKAMNVDLASELDAALAPFDDAEVAPLRGRFKRSNSKVASAKTKAATKVAAPAKKAASSSTSSNSLSEAGIRGWALKLPPMKNPYLADPWQRDHDALLALGAAAVGQEKTGEAVAKGLREVLKKPPRGVVLAWALQWSAVLLASEVLTEDEIVKLVELYMPAKALVVLARRRKWKASVLRQLSKDTQYGWKKKQVPPHVSATFAEAAKALGK